MDLNKKAHLYYIAKQSRYLLDTSDDWVSWAKGKGSFNDFKYIHWKDQRIADYNIMLELTRLGVESVTPAAKLIALEFIKKENPDGFK